MGSRYRHGPAGVRPALVATSAGTADLSLKESMWLSCPTKTCCSYYTVYPTGFDIWRISHELQVAPWTFTRAVPAEAAPDAFALDDSEKRFRLALQKVTKKSRGLAPCVFLLRLNDGTARCGLGEMRPDPCQSFPALMMDGRVYVRNDGGCRCRTWSLSEVDVHRESQLLAREQKAQETYCRVIANWNEFAVRYPSDSALDYRDFCRFLLDIYTQLSRTQELQEA